jgi:hypothetical protein
LINNKLFTINALCDGDAAVDVDDKRDVKDHDDDDDDHHHHDHHDDDDDHNHHRRDRHHDDHHDDRHGDHDNLGESWTLSRSHHHPFRHHAPKKDLHKGEKWSYSREHRHAEIVEGKRDDVSAPNATDCVERRTRYEVAAVEFRAYAVNAWKELKQFESKPCV